MLIRADSKFDTADVVAAAERYDACVSLTTGSNPSVNTAITSIPDTAWTAIHYPEAFVDTETGELVPTSSATRTSRRSLTRPSRAGRRSSRSPAG